MTTPNVLNQKWLSDVELLDFEIEQSEALKPANVEKFFTSIASSQMGINLTQGIISEVTKELQETIPWVFIANASSLPLVYFPKIING